MDENIKNSNLKDLTVGMNCNADLKNTSKSNQLNKRPSESTIEVKAEEIK